MSMRLLHMLNSKVEKLWFMRMLHENVKENVTYSGMLNSRCPIVYENVT
jgi:hypothetical protein